MIREIIFALALSSVSICASAQQQLTPDEEVWQPEPGIVTPGRNLTTPPSDAIVLFDGRNLDEWETTVKNPIPAHWRIARGELIVNKKEGDIQTKRKFVDYQLHVEWKIPATITGEGQSRGNSGIILASTGQYDYGYELQVLDSYKNKTYVNGQAGAVYKQYIPIVNASKHPGEWQIFDIVWTAPRFNDDGSLKSKARITAFYNGVLVQNSVELRTPSSYDRNNPDVQKNGAAPIKLQAHGDPSEPISFRNIWVRPL